uniref:Uncharacterized protein n=1 Tax=Branchiostoma floridae TaxID=7739 RepID=C3YP02_BRAFL|eukprot:XP_002601881.1 hypothetical protein BRAFLDRAFT_86358 [Branchiostoma floridae]
MCPRFSGRKAAMGPRFSGRKAAMGPTFSGRKAAVGPTFTRSKAAVAPTFAGSRAVVGPTFAGSRAVAGLTFAGSKAAVGPTFTGSSKYYKVVSSAVRDTHTGKWSVWPSQIRTEKSGLTVTETHRGKWSVRPSVSEIRTERSGQFGWIRDADRNAMIKMDRRCAELTQSHSSGRGCVWGFSPS